MKVQGAIDEDQVVLGFAMAEFTSPRHRDRVAAWVESSMRTKLLAKPPDSWNGVEQRAAREAVLGYRGPILKELLDLRPTWSEVSIVPEELAALETISFLPFETLAPDRKLGTLVAAMDAGQETPNDGFSAGYRALRSKFDPAKTRGHPSIVAVEESGPFIVFEGLTRLSVLQSLKTHDQKIPDPIGLYLGVSDRLRSWRFY